MSNTKVIGAAGVATTPTLPVTGSPTLAIAIAGCAMLIAGLLLLRSGRLRRQAS
jgi:LPXTG-motif cell wall-anchored protein